MTKIHFEDLWDKGEAFHKETNQSDSIQSIVDEVMMKLNIYKAIDARLEINVEERNRIKTRTLGEILLTLTSISLKDNINVFESLVDALKYRNISFK